MLSGKGCAPAASHLDEAADDDPYHVMEKGIATDVDGHKWLKGLHDLLYGLVEYKPR